MKTAGLGNRRSIHLSYGAESENAASNCQKLPPTAHPLHTPKGRGDAVCTGSTGGALLPGRAGVEASTEEVRRELSLVGLESVSLPARRAEALRWVELLPGATARELERASKLRKVAQRLTELERQGVVRGCTPRVCSVTGRVATTWHPTGAPPSPLPRLPSRRVQLEALQAEVVRLREALATVAAPLVLDGEEHAAAARLARETLAEVAP